MVNEKLYKANEICEKLKITNWTLRNWYSWEKKRIENGIVDKPYLPKPEILTNAKGKPRVWTKEQFEELKNYQKNIVTGRNGIYGIYSNPAYKETKKYKKSLQTK